MVAGQPGASQPAGPDQPAWPWLSSVWRSPSPTCTLLVSMSAGHTSCIFARHHDVLAKMHVGILMKVLYRSSQLHASISALRTHLTWGAEGSRAR